MHWHAPARAHSVVVTIDSGNFRLVHHQGDCLNSMHPLRRTETSRGQTENPRWEKRHPRLWLHPAELPQVSKLGWKLSA